MVTGALRIWEQCKQKWSFYWRGSIQMYVNVGMFRYMSVCSYMWVFACVCVCLCKCVYISACLCLCMCILKYVHICVCLWMFLYICMSVLEYFVCVCLSMCVYACVYLYTCMLWNCVSFCVCICWVCVYAWRVYNWYSIMKNIKSMKDLGHKGIFNSHPPKKEK